MKNFRHLLLTIICTLFAVNSIAAASPMTQGEQKAQTALRSFLSGKKVNTKIDPNDNSVNFNYKGILFWVTFKEMGNDGILYTLHRANIKLANNPAREKGVFATNYLNRTHDYKAYVVGDHAAFVFPTFATSPEEYTKVFMSLLKSMENIKEDFRVGYNKAKTTTDSIHNWWSVNDTTVIVVKQPNAQPIQSSNNLTASQVEFRIVDANGTPITQYGESIRKSDLRFIQPQLTVKATKKGMYHIGVVITAPNGKKMFPASNSDRTILSTVEVDKKAKPVDLGIFGNNTGDCWVAGEYTVTFYEDGNLIKTATFNVL